MVIRLDLSSLITIAEWKPQKEKGNEYRYVVGQISEPKNDTFIGIDPGVNFGFTIIAGPVVMICHGKLPVRKHPWEHGLDVFDFVERHIIEYDSELNRGFAVVEGASYQDKFGQVGLESVRFAFYKSLLDKGIKTVIKAPKSIRAAVLGGGKNTAFDRWPLLNHNAADSLGAALLAYLGVDDGEED